MPDLALDLRYLSYAILVAEHGSFRAAAESLDLAQSTVSRRVQLLEHRLGITLFERGRNGTRLTATGERFIQSAALGAEQLRIAILDARKADRGERGELRIGTIVSLAGGFLADLLARYRIAFPLIDLRVEEISNQHGEASLVNNSLDVLCMTAEPCSERCISRPLWSERLVAAVRRDHPLSAAQAICWSDLAGEAIILSAAEQTSEFGRLLHKKLSSGCKPSKITYHGVGRDSLLGLVSRGFGALVTLESTSGDTRKDVIFVPIFDDDAIAHVHLVWTDNVRNSAVAPFVEFAGNQPTI